MMEVRVEVVRVAGEEEAFDLPVMHCRYNIKYSSKM